MYYPGDIIPFLVSLGTATGAPATVTAPPQITVLNSYDDTALDIAGVGVKTAPMTLVVGSDSLYKFNWSTAGVADGTYVAVVSYAADSVTVNNRFLEKVRLGDSRILSQVAGAALTAKVSDLPDKTQVMLKTDFVAPASDLSIQQILGKVNNLPDSPADQTTLASVLALIGDVKDAQLGTWQLDKSVTPNVLSLFRINGALLQQFTVTNNSSTGARTRS